MPALINLYRCTYRRPSAWHLVLEAILHGGHQLRRVVELLGLARGQDLAHNVADSVRSEDAGQGEEDLLVDAVLTLDQCGYRVHVVGVAEDGRGQRGHGQTDGPGGVALQTDHLVGTLHNLLVQLLPVLGIGIGPHVRIDLTQTHTSNVHTGPHGHRGVSVLT